MARALRPMLLHVRHGTVLTMMLGGAERTVWTASRRSDAISRHLRFLVSASARRRRREASGTLWPTPRSITIGRAMRTPRTSDANILSAIRNFVRLTPHNGTTAQIFWRSGAGDAGMILIWEEAERARLQQEEPAQHIVLMRDDACKLLSQTLRPRPMLTEWLVARHPFACIRMSRRVMLVMVPLALACACAAAFESRYLVCLACLLRAAAIWQSDVVHAGALAEPSALSAAHRISRGLSSPLLVAGRAANFAAFVAIRSYIEYDILQREGQGADVWCFAMLVLTTPPYIVGVLLMIWRGSADELEARGTLTGSTTEFVVDAAKEEALRADDAECIVCFSEFSCGDACRKLPCGHFFHTECIDQWLAPPNGRARTSCPVCSRPLTGGFAPTEYDRIAFGLGAPSHGAEEHTAQRARLWTVGYPRADHLAGCRCTLCRSSMTATTTSAPTTCAASSSSTSSGS